MSSGYKYATVNASDVPATQTNFPAYVDLSRLGITTLAEAESVRVYADSSKTTEWAREIVSATEMHVKVPSLTSTTSIYVDWDGVSADYAVTDTYGRNAVWSAYAAVFHGDTTLESTGNNSITHTNVSNVSGKLGQAFDATGASNSYSTIGTKLGTFWDNQYTLQFWFNMDAKDGVNGDVFVWPGDRNQQHILATTSSGRLELSTYSTPTSSVVIGSTGSIPLSTWKMSHWQRTSGTTGKLFLDGVDDTSASATMRNPAGTLTQDFRLFSRQDYTVANGDLKIDEIRFRTGNLSANWITTEYNNQSDEAGFWGTWSDVGGGGNTTDFFIMA